MKQQESLSQPTASFISSDPDVAERLKKAEKEIRVKDSKLAEIKLKLAEYKEMIKS